MTQVVIPAIRDGAGALVPATVTVRLVGSDEQGRIAFVATDLATEYQDVALPEAGLTLGLQPQSLLALPAGASSWYRVELRTQHRRESFLIQVPESGTPLALRDLVGAAEIPPGSLPADIVADVLEAAAEAEDSATTATEQAGFAAESANSAGADAGTASEQAGIASAAANTATLQAGIAGDQAVIASSQAGFATDAAGSAAADALTASGQAAIATAQAGEATSQAGTAALQAGLASDSADLAHAWATQTDPEVVTGQGYGALRYAQDAASSAAIYPAVQEALTAIAADLIATQAVVVAHHAFA